MLLMYLLSSYSRASSRHQISGAREQHIQIFILPCKWVPSFPFLFGAAGTVIMQMKTGSKTKGTTYSEEVIGRHLNGFLGLSLNDRNILFLAILLDKTVSVG